MSQAADEVRDSYDAVAEQYAKLFLTDLVGDANSQGWLAAFAELAAQRTGPVADLGCGPGHVVDHLATLGVVAVGFDLSPGQIAQARTAFPDVEFHVGDLAALDVADSSLGGIVARYSLIHLVPSGFDDVFLEWMRVLEPGAPVLISFFASSSAEAHATPFDHTVATAYELFPATVAQQLSDAGFVVIDAGVCDPPAGGRPLGQGTVLARKPNAWR